MRSPESLALLLSLLSPLLLAVSLGLRPLLRSLRRLGRWCSSIGPIIQAFYALNAATALLPLSLLTLEILARLSWRGQHALLSLVLWLANLPRP